MKVLLLEDEKKLGKKGEIVNIADAYAMNAVIPRGIGKVATPDVIAQVEKAVEAKGKQNRAEALEAEHICQKLQGNVLTLTQKAEGGKLFGAVKMVDLANCINQSYNVIIEASQIASAETIKTTGEHKVTVNCGHGQSAEMTLHVTEE